MNLVDRLRRAQDGAIVNRMGERVGLDSDQAGAVLEQVIPELTHNIERNTLSRGGLADLIDTLSQLHRSDYLGDPDLVGGERAREDGTELLEQIVGTKHQSRIIAARAARQTGVSADKIERMLPEIAAVSMGGLSQQTFGPIGDILSKLPGGPELGSAPTGGGGFSGQSPLPVPGQSTPSSPMDQGPLGNGWSHDSSSGAPSFPDAGGRGQFENQSPLPVPGGAPGGNWGGGSGGQGQRGGYRDLSDILRRRGGGLPGQGGGSLWSIVRQVIGSALGFRNGGVMSWIIRLILFRVAWPMLKRVLFGR
ncbi:MAG: DUF937 domain-containing protein [Pseudomonadota bacterium]